MADMVLGVFGNRTNAEEAINTLESKGFNPKDMSVVMKDTEEAKELGENTGADVAGGAVSGATTGGIIGGLAGLLIGIGAIAIPGVGALLIGGPLAAALGLSGAAATTVSGAVTGALAGGLIGALTSWGVSEDDAKYYESRIKEGGIFVAVPAMHDQAMAESILRDHGADQVRTVSTRDEGNRDTAKEEAHQQV